MKPGTQMRNGRSRTAIVAKAGQPLRVSDLDSIEALLAGAGVTWDTFVAEARRHSWSRVTNPIGFLKSLAKSFRAKSQLASAPVTAAEAEERDYQCPKCFSRIRGEGVRLEGTKTVSCECASPEYVRKMIERKIIATPEIDPHGETGTLPTEAPRDLRRRKAQMITISEPGSQGNRRRHAIDFATRTTRLMSCGARDGRAVKRMNRILEYHGAGRTQV
jgi:hypothetical protein